AGEQRIQILSFTQRCGACIRQSAGANCVLRRIAIGQAKPDVDQLGRIPVMVLLTIEGEAETERMRVLLPAQGIGGIDQRVERSDWEVPSHRGGQTIGRTSSEGRPPDRYWVLLETLSRVGAEAVDVVEVTHLELVHHRGLNRPIDAVRRGE